MVPGKERVAGEKARKEGRREPLLRELTGRAPEGAGGKAAGIAALRAAGFTVPRSWVVLPSEVKKLFGGAGLGAARAFLAEAARTLAGSFPVMVRSSAPLEDQPGAAAPGVYLSAPARDLRELASAAARCAASAGGPAARLYGKAVSRRDGPGSGRAAGGMALLIQPFIKAPLGAVCTLYHKQELVVELARGGTAAITAGSGKVWRASFGPDGKLLGKPQAGLPLKAASAAAAAALHIQRALYPTSNISVELALPGGRPVILQARVFGAAAGNGLYDFSAIFASVSRLLAGLGFRPGEWALSETPVLLAYNYLGLSRPANETLEHFVVNLSPAGLARARARGWIRVRHGEDLTLFPPKTERGAHKKLAALAAKGLLFIFREDLPGNAVKLLPLGGGASMPFSFVLSHMSGNEADFIRRRLTPEQAAGMCERLDLEQSLLRSVLARLRSDATAYGRRLAHELGAQLRQLRRQRAVAASCLSRRSDGAGIKGVPARRENRTVEGPAVTGRDILLPGPRRFIYAAHDFEPSFLSRIGRVQAVAISRGAVGSHAAAICAEFGVPLLVGTRNLARIRTGDRLKVDLLTGLITCAPGARRAK